MHARLSISSRSPRAIQTLMARSLALLALALAACQSKDKSRDTSQTSAAGGGQGGSAACASDNGGLTLPEGFCATIFADSIGHARHLVVSPAGVVYVSTWSGQYFNTPAPAGGFVVALRDTNGDGRADARERFGDSAKTAGAGGTGIALYKNALYVEAKDKIVRYALTDSAAVPTGQAETIVSGLPLTGDHPMHPFAIDTGGGIYVDLGSASNACQVKNRTLTSPGRKPCRELDTRGGVWRYDANKTNQRFSPAERYSTGIRNAVGIAVDPSGAVYSTQHGRDQLAENWPKLFTPEQGQNLPSEEVMRLEQGADFGWPYCYFDGEQKKLVLAPEYGGDGKEVGDCASKRAPAAFFPAHWAPNDILFYTGTQFPERYRNGIFIPFHGSWNRAPGPQGGYNVVFQPMQNGTASGAYEVFADGFAGANKQPDAAAHRPAGLAMGPDGALYIADDKGGRIWRVVHRGGGR